MIYNPYFVQKLDEKHPAYNRKEFKFRRLVPLNYLGNQAT